MLKTIKSKIIVITLSLLILLSIVSVFLAYNDYKNGKIMRTDSCDLQIDYFTEEINNVILQFQENAKDLAVNAEMFYNFNKTNYDLPDYIVHKSFEKNNQAIGGGIWFEPYIIDPEKKRFSSYVYYENNNLFFDKKSESEVYNYHEKNWYTEIKEELSTKNPIVWVTPYMDTLGTNSYMTTVGVGIYDRDSNLVGIATVDWELDSIIKKISQFKPTKNSFVLFADKNNDFILAYNNDKAKSGQSLTIVPWYETGLIHKKEFKYKNVKYIPFIKTLSNNMMLIVNVPTNELYGQLRHQLELMFIFLLLTYTFITGLMYLILTYNINKPIKYLAKIASEIGEGKLDTKAQLNTPEEFAMLANTLNKMTEDIKEYIKTISVVTAEKKQMEFELKTAKAIQYSALPSIFPPYPNHHEFEIFALMDTAKEVGGDFYDFFFINPDNLAFLVADVSGKGIPAALFMMKTKTLIKNLAKTGISLEELTEKVNKSLCKNNEQGLFVTLLFCVLELSSGLLTFINAGHNPPLIKKCDGTFDYLNCEPNFVLGAFNSAEYKSCQIQLNRKDMIFLYTDGITEAENSKKEFFGEERLLSLANEKLNFGVEEFIKTLKTNIDNYIKDEEKTDDITMLAIEYFGAKSFILPADVNELPELVKRIEHICNKLKIEESQRTKLIVSAEEIFVNIANYGYPENNGNVEITIDIVENSVQITFTDNGIKYNPLTSPEPDITLEADKRSIGGLGIYMVKKSMDSVDYTYKDGKNILTIKMNIL